MLLDPDAEKDIERTKAMFAPTVDVVAVGLRGYKDAGDTPRTELWSQILDACTAAGLDPGKFTLEI